MRIETQRELLRRFFAMREAHTTTFAEAPYRQRASVYTDSDRSAAEFSALFRGRPLIVAMSADVPGTGDCLALEVAGVPLLLVRGEDAEVRAFLNICRHRGGRVFSGRGRPGRAFKCPYHSWAYDLNGDLLGQPLARDAFEGLDRAELGLLPVRTAERFGLILCRIGSDEPIDVEAELAGLGPELGDYGFADWTFFAEQSTVVDANWKLVYDTFLESYHIFSLHKDSLAGDLLSTPFVGDPFGPHTRGVVMRKEVTDLLERPEADWTLRPYSAIVYILFPNALINLPMSGHLELWGVYPEPDDPHRTRVSVRFFVPPTAKDDGRDAFWEANVRVTQRVVFEEDFGQQEDIHRSLRSGLLPEVIYGRNEPALIHHHVQIERALAAARSVA